MQPVFPVVGHSTFEYPSYGTEPPTSSSEFVAVVGDAAVRAAPPCNRMFILGFDVFIDAGFDGDGLDVEATETSITVTVTRGSTGQWAVFSQAATPTLIPTNRYATASHQFATPIPFINMNGELSGEAAYDPAFDDVSLYGFVHGVAGVAGNARVVIYWARMAP